MARMFNSQRLRDAVSGPGADTRRWTGLVLLDSDPQADEQGLFCDGHLVPEDLPTTVRLRPAAVGNGFGVFLPRATSGQLLVVVFPSGDPAGGAVEVGPLNSDEEPVPEEVRRRPQDVWFLAEPGADVRIRVTGGGGVRIEAPLVDIVTTGDPSTSKVVIDGVPWSGLQLQTQFGPTAGPPVAGPTGTQALTDLAAWRSDRRV